MMDGWKKFEGKKVFIILKNQRKYTGIILEVEQGNGDILIVLKDKFDSMVSFHSSDIELIQEERKE